ncbi:MAG TPA: arginine--tRNA ligase, partial [Thermodesulfobacteriota bacterium]|nr:arginine--tRNA ligase [Thermodesulfobacteriota bacterium]
MREQLVELIRKALQQIGGPGDRESLEAVPVLFSIPKNAQYGDYATNVAMGLAKVLKRSPLQIAEDLVRQIPSNLTWLDRVEVAKPGFINFYLKDQAFQETLPLIIRAGASFGQAAWGAGQKIQVEFVSANPTGPLHIGHGRGAALGGALANLLRATGHTVETEYYLNDVGTQMETLGRSIQTRARELIGEPVEFPENCYQGEYIKDIAREIIREKKDWPQADLAFFSQQGRKKILTGIKEDLDTFGIPFDCWFSEESLYTQGLVDDLIREMQDRGLFYQEAGALWFKSSAFGDEKDRVVIRSNGAKTYFASDITYHLQKFDRGFDRVIDIWGADHHGYVPRIKAALKSRQIDPERLTVVLVQLVNLLREGKPVAMSTRAGEFVTLREVINEVGKNAARYIFLTRRSDSPLDFDLEVAKKQGLENPVYYVQYAHARVQSVLRVAESQGLDGNPLGFNSLHRLDLPEERALCKQLTEYPEIILQAALNLEP